MLGKIKIDKKTQIFAYSLLIILIYFTNIVLAVEISVYRECPITAKVGSMIQINITVENNGISEKNIRVNELVGDFEPIEPQPIIPIPEPGLIGLRPPYYEWNFTLLPNSKNTVYYIIELTNPGDIILSPTTIYGDGETIYTDTCIIKVICNQNGKCESELKENYFTCVQDCPSGSRDNVCDLIRDGRCDPDCEENTDFDCLITTTTLPVTISRTPIYIYLIIIFVVISIIIFLIYKIKVVR